MSRIALLVVISASFVAVAVADDLPTSFDLRDVRGYNYVTGIRDQGPYGTCWAFGLLASVESNLLVNDSWRRASEFGEADLSEAHLDWWCGFNKFNNDDTDPSQGGGLDTHSGGTAGFLCAYYSRGDGLIRESDAPYTGIAQPPERLLPSYHRFYIHDVDILIAQPDLSNIDAIKSKIMSNGGVSTTIFASGLFLHNFGSYFCHYQPPGDPTPINHEISLIGWDDEKITQAPEGPGAWLVKNSWGDWGPEHGIFWISYYDKWACQIADLTGAAVSFNQVQLSPFSRFYYHDYHGWTDTLAFASAFNAFVAVGDDLVSAVSFYTSADDVSYTARIYARFEDGVLLDELAQQSGHIAFRGFHTVYLAQVIRLNSGEPFYVRLDLSAGGQPLDRTFDANGVAIPGGNYRGEVLVESAALPGQSYYLSEGQWRDLYDYDFPDPRFDHSANFCIKVLAEPDCNANDTPDSRDIALGFSDDRNRNLIPDECEPHITVYVDDDAPGDPLPGDPTISDPNEDGSPGHPFDAIQEAIDSLGDLSGRSEVIDVLVADGEYRGFGNRDLYLQGRLLTVKSQNGPQHCLIDGEFDSQGSGTGFWLSADLPASQVSGFSIVRTSYAGIVCAYGCSAIIENCRIADSNLAGIFCFGQAHPSVHRSRLENNYYYGVLCENGGLSGAGNVVRGSYAGVYCTGSPVLPPMVSLRDCVVFGNQSNGVFTSDASLVLDNCSILSNAASGVAVGGAGRYVSLSNCILWDNDPYAHWQLEAFGVALGIKYSDVAGGLLGLNLGPDVNLEWGADSNLDVDPGFAAGDYHLSPDSPCIDAGDPSGAYALRHDIDDQLRVLDGDGDGVAYADVGADELAITTLVADMNCDGAVTYEDVDPFVLALSDPEAYLLLYPNCDLSHADVNGDGQRNFEDIDPFIELLPVL